MVKDRILDQAAFATKGRYLLYWMQQAQRMEANYALEYAALQAERLQLPLVVVFILCADVPEANNRHYTFMMQGIAELAMQVAKTGISFYLACGKPVQVVGELAQQAVEVVLDHGYLHYQRQWRSELKQVMAEMQTSYTEVETEAMVPVHTVSDHEEYAAATIRKKLLGNLRDEPIRQVNTMHIPPFTGVLASAFPLVSASEMNNETLENWWREHLPVDTSVEPVPCFTGGQSHAHMLLASFLKDKLIHYHNKRNDPSLSIQSNLSPYLHYGQISAMEIIQQLVDYVGCTLLDLPTLILAKSHPDPWVESAASFSEELIVRRELSFNFCTYNDDYDNFNCLPNWARQTLFNHLGDEREGHYSLDKLIQYDTNDVYWNAAQREMMTTGKMHNYMRMYWGKRILAWCDNPEAAYQMILYLNNRYELDGRDPNSYAGIAWCFGKHDRPWQERKIYGIVRYMNANGLERKFDMNTYVKNQNPEV